MITCTLNITCACSFVLAGGETHRVGRDNGPGEIVAVAPGTTATQTRRYGTVGNDRDVDRGDHYCRHKQSVVGPGTIEPDLTSDRVTGNPVFGGTDVFAPPP